MTTKPHDWPNPTLAETVENPDGTITHEGRRYVPEDRIIRELSMYDLIFRTQEGNVKVVAEIAVDVLNRILRPEKEDRDDG